MKHKKVVIVILSFVYLNLQADQEVDYFVDLISKSMKDSLTYQWPTDATEFYSNSAEENFGTFDFVIIGAGASGTVIANRLSENPHWNILLLEAGGYGNNKTEVPNLYSAVSMSSYNWAYNGTPQTTAFLGTKSKSCMYARGKGVGGTTLINGLVYARGYKSDFDKWAEVVNDNRWKYKTVLKYFRKSENFVHNDKSAPYDPEYHGTKGPLRVEFHKPKSPQLNAFLKANEELGFQLVDYNANKLGVSQSQVNTVNGRRLDGDKAFIKPIQNRKNLRISTGSYVTKIRIKDGVAEGVEFSKNGKRYFVEVRKEVVLSAGAIASPQLLMLSGVGPRKHLEDLGIDVVSNLEVGSTLYDNPNFFGISISTNYTEEIKPLEDYVKEFLNGGGPYAIANNNQGVGFYESSYTKGTGTPDIELEFLPSNATNELSKIILDLTDETYEDLWKNIKVEQSLVIYVIALHAISSGSVRLRSKNPYEYPLIDSNLLSDPENRDINTLYEGIELVLKLLETNAFKGMNAKLQGGPLRACRQYEYLSREYWFCALRQLTLELYHPLGSCPMGKTAKDGIVDSEFKVFGVDKLRVADASVFPFALAGHPNAPCVMVGERVADFIKEKL